MRPRTGLHVVHWLAAAALVLSTACGFTAGPPVLYQNVAAVRRMPSAGTCLDKRQVATSAVRRTCELDATSRAGQFQVMATFGLQELNALNVPDSVAKKRTEAEKRQREQWAAMVAMTLHEPRCENLGPDSRPSKDKMSRLSFLASIPATVAVASVAVVRPDPWSTAPREGKGKGGTPS